MAVVKKQIREKAEIFPDFWVEFGSGKTGVTAALYKGRGVGGAHLFNRDHPFLTLDTKDLRLQDVTSVFKRAVSLLQWKPAIKPRYSTTTSQSQRKQMDKVFRMAAGRETALKKAITFMLQGLQAPDKYANMTQIFHVNAIDPASRDLSVSTRTGKVVQNADTAAKQENAMEKKKKILTARAVKIISGLNAFFEFNGFPPDPAGGMGGMGGMGMGMGMGMQQPPAINAGTGLPIQKKNLDLLGSVDISSDPSETEDVESAISSDTTNQAIIIFEKFNPPTRENLKGLKEFCEIVKRENGDGFIFISQVFTEEDPPELLSYEETVRVLKEIMEERNIKAKLVDDPNIETLTDVANYLASDGYQSLVICTTSDKLGEYQNELTRKNNIPTESGTFYFEPIDMRKIDSLGDSEMKDINNAALDGDFGIFLKHIGTGDINLAKKIYTKIRKEAV